MPNNNGLAVLGVFLEIGSEKNEELEKLLLQISQIKYKGDTRQIAQDLYIEKLLPGSQTLYIFLDTLALNFVNVGIIFSFWHLFQLNLYNMSVLVSLIMSLMDLS